MGNFEYDEAGLFIGENYRTISIKDRGDKEVITVRSYDYNGHLVDIGYRGKTVTLPGDFCRAMFNENIRQILFGSW